MRAPPAAAASDRDAPGGGGAGRPYVAGEIIRQPLLAGALRAIAAGGAEVPLGFGRIVALHCRSSTSY